MQETLQPNAFGLAHLWAAGDAVSHTVAVLIVVMSVASWYLILAKAWDWWRLREAAKAVPSFWAAGSVGEGIARLHAAGADSPYAQLATQANCCNHDCETVSGRLASRFDPSEQMERALRQQLSTTQAGMENGLTFLATTGATAPFVGLFGTVWGIMHAFTGLASLQQVTLATVAPGIAEALVATAIGLFAAIPAVVAYNRFAHDIDRVANKLETFIEEFSNILQRNLGAHSASGH